MPAAKKSTKKKSNSFDLNRQAARLQDEYDADEKDRKKRYKRGYNTTAQSAEIERVKLQGAKDLVKKGMKTKRVNQLLYPD